MIAVNLSWTEVDFAAAIGCRRYVRALSRGRRESTGRDERIGAFDAHILGALGECAAAKALGLYWSASTEPDYDGDVVEGLHVRTTERATGCLILHPGDQDGRYVLVTGSVAGGSAAFYVRGYVESASFKQPEFWREDRPLPAYFIEQRHLTPLHPKGTPHE